MAPRHATMTSLVIALLAGCVETPSQSAQGGDELAREEARRRRKRDAGGGWLADARLVTRVDLGAPAASDGSVGTASDSAMPPVSPPPATTCTTQCRYVRAGATGNNSGLDWTNAYPSFPATPQRGLVYLVADGSYPGLMLDAPASGTQPITIQKATLGDHGTSAGWQASYGDGQATFSDVILVSDHWIIDGRRRDESDWAKIEAYGFRVAGGFYSHSLNFGRCADHVIVKYVDIGGPKSTTFDPSIPKEAFYFGGFTDLCEDWLISRVHAHNVYMVGQMAGVDRVVWEHSRFGPTWGKATIRGQAGRASNVTVRYNVFKDTCQGTPGDPTAGACTTQVGWYGNGDGSENFDNGQVYGNLFWITHTVFHSDACLLFGTTRSSTTGDSARNSVAYSNTFVGIQSGSCVVKFDGVKTGSAARNNVWHGLGASVYTGCTAETCSHNEIITNAGQFVSPTSGNFRLAVPTKPGFVLTTPYGVDIDGRPRGADGTFDLGAYEFSAP